MSSDELELHWPAQAGSPPIVSRLHEWVMTVDHKRLGIMYIRYALVFLVIGGIEATIMRIQLVVPHNDFVSPQVFNRMFTMHGTTMIFLRRHAYGVRIWHYLVPLMIGARDMAFPRLNAFSFWMTAFGGLLLYFSFVGAYGLFGAGNAPDVGWWAYAPLTSPAFSKGHSTDYWILALLVSGVGSIGRAVNFVATILCHALSGYEAREDAVACVDVLRDVRYRAAGHQSADGGANHADDRSLPGWAFLRYRRRAAPPSIWMHFFWIFGHPEVYILIIPCFAFVSEIVPVFSRKAIFGYPIMVAATVAIGFVSMSVWAHHMFTMGMASYSNAFFVLTTMAVGVPTGIKIFNWVGTMWGGKIRYATPMLFCLAFLFQFLVAGLTGIMLSAAPFDWQLSHSYFVVAHFHYVIVGGNSFRALRSFLLLVSQDDGKDVERDTGQVAFLALRDRLPSHFRFHAHSGHSGHAATNLYLRARTGLGDLEHDCDDRRGLPGGRILVFVFNLVRSYFKGRLAGNDPWDAWTLEWSIPSPPPVYNFAVVPEVRSRRPLWDLKHPEDPDWKYDQ